MEAHEATETAEHAEHAHGTPFKSRSTLLMVSLIVGIIGTLSAVNGFFLFV